MYLGDLITVSEACDLLNISRTTLSIYRKKYSVSNIKIKREVKFSKTEILYKLYSKLNLPGQKVNLSLHTNTEFEAFRIDDTSYDLRKIEAPDGHGAISLLCHLVSEINKGKNIHLLINESNSFLKSMNFFGELKRHLNSNVFWNEDVFNNMANINHESIIKLPIRRLGVVGAQTSIVDDLTVGLKKQGYSNDICSYIGWAMGELADTSETHSKIHPSFVYFEQFGEDKRFLQFTIGDAGVGIPESLRKNEHYKSLNNKEAVLTSFKPYVSGRPDEEERGKGLTDVLMIAMECGSRLLVESNGVGFSFSFDSGLDNFEVVSPLYKDDGTVISILFIDGNFDSLERDDVKTYIDSCLEKI